MNTSRKSGILLHITSLPCTYGIGSLGKAAFDFVDFLSASRTGLWQILPIGPTGYGDSPYQSFSSFAINPLLIDFDDLVQRGWAEQKDASAPTYIKNIGKTRVDYGKVVAWKTGALQKLSQGFLSSITNPDSKPDFPSDAKAQFYAFCRENMFWLKDYAAFMSIKHYYDEQARLESEQKGEYVNGMWNAYWPKPLALHEDQAVEEWINSHTEDFLSQEVIQFFAFSQWKALRNYANSKNVEIIGDIPIFVSPDSSDVWSNRQLFCLDNDGVPIDVAGVPPDYFSREGQLWGNPLYDWMAMKADGFKWWIERIKNMLTLTDYVRVDHFRGFAGSWAVPYGSANAVNGKWIKNPGEELFCAIKNALGDLPLIAEDLGIITDDVRALRDKFGFPGMKILQFAFDLNEAENGSLQNGFLPHNFDTSNCVAYTGTHDNDTLKGWFETLNDDLLALIASYVSGRECKAQEAQSLKRRGVLRKELIRLAFSSSARFAIIPIQDLYNVGSEGRMNTPATDRAN